MNLVPDNVHARHATVVRWAGPTEAHPAFNLYGKAVAEAPIVDMPGLGLFPVVVACAGEETVMLALAIFSEVGAGEHQVQSMVVIPLENVPAFTQAFSMAMMRYPSLVPQHPMFRDAVPPREFTLHAWDGPAR